MDLNLYLEKTAEHLDKTIFRYFGSVFGDLYSAGAHLMTAGGKRLRPAVLLLSADAIRKGSSDGLMPAALGLEMTHTFTLIHDDIMDRDAVRRGVPTVHTLWDESTAILAGDVLYAKSFEFLCMADADDKAKVRAVVMLARGCAEICEGQSLDMSFERRSDVTEAEYLEMVRKKTGALYAASAAIGGVLAGADPVQADALYHYGLNSGISFQIQDDLIDFLTPSDESGKDRASDIREGKQTLIAIKAREAGIDLSAYRRDLTGSEINDLVRILEDAGVIEYVRKLALEKVETAKLALSVLPESEEKQLLLEMADFFVVRGF